MKGQKLATCQLFIHYAFSDKKKKFTLHCRGEKSTLAIGCEENKNYKFFHTLHIQLWQMTFTWKIVKMS